MTNVLVIFLQKTVFFCLNRQKYKETSKFTTLILKITDIETVPFYLRDNIFRCMIHVHLYFLFSH